MRLDYSIISFLKLLVIYFFGAWLAVFAGPSVAQKQNSCSGCLCPDDPCNLCPLPPMTDVPPSPNESEMCARIRERVPPTSAQPGSNEYFPSLDRSTAVCISEGGDVIRNRRRSDEFPARVYCKPPAAMVNRSGSSK